MTLCRRTPIRSWSLAAFVAATSLAGCSMKVMKPTSEDSVRQRVADLQRRNQALENENQGLRARISELTSDLPSERSVAENARPRLAGVSIASTSNVEPGPDRQTLVLRMSPRDDRGRFIQLVGTLEVRAVSVPAAGPPRLLASKLIDPLSVREGWRGGILGSGYVFDIELEDPGHQLPPTIDVVTIFTDADSGREIRDEAPVAVSVEPTP